MWLLVGSDTLADLPHWHDPVRLVGLAGLLVMARPTTPLLSAEQLREMLRLPADAPLRLDVVQAPILIDISSRELRRRIAEGHTIRYLVPRAVEVYLQEKGLYRVDSLR
jgi:nicotinate-nucleotide adenylyltransferase